MLGPVLQGCQGYGRRGPGSQRLGQSGTSGKHKETERRDVIEAGSKAHIQASGYMVNNVESRKDSNTLIDKTGRGPALVISQIGFLLIVFI